MTDDPRQIAAGLTRLKNVDKVWRAADRRLAAGDPEFLADLGVALHERYAGDDPPWQYRSVRDYLTRALALKPGAENVAQALRLPVDARHLASLLASAQPPDALAALPGASADLRACLDQEMVLRGMPVAERRRGHHPLAWLPGELSPVEGRPAMPSYHTRGGSTDMPYGPPDLPLLRASGARVAPAREITTPEVAAALGAAVTTWVNGSNGRVEARVFELAPPPGPQPGPVGEAVPDRVAGLGLECLAGPKPLRLGPCPPARAWRILFAAASSGGAYTSGEYGAYGRLAAWRSMAALAGASVGDSFAEVESEVTACAWYSFEATTKWFEQVAWDIGLVAVNPAGRLAVLAATDTD